MKKYILISFISFLFAVPAAAQTLSLPESAMHSCRNSSECVLLSESCTDSCASVPINKTFEKEFISKRKTMCGGTLPENAPRCNVRPELQPACINNRCTIGYAFQNHADSRDYLNGGHQGYSQRN